MSNLLTATKSLIRIIWKKVEDSDESDESGISECVAAIQANADKADPLHSLDLLSFIYVFAFVFFGLVPKDIVERRKGEIHAVMGELAAIVPGPDGTEWSNSYGKCAEQTYSAFHWAHLEDRNLIPKLSALIY